MASFNKFNSFVAQVANGEHNLATAQLVIALTNSAPTAANAHQADITEISYTNCSSRNVTTSSSTQTGGLYSLMCANLTLTASGTVGAFRYAVLYNSSDASKDLIGWWDYGSSITLNSGETFVVNFDQINGVFQLS